MCRRRANQRARHAKQGTTPQKPGSRPWAPDAKEMLTRGLQLPLLGPVPTSSLNTALPSGDNLEILGWRKKVSDKVLHTTVLKTVPSCLLKDSALQPSSFDRGDRADPSVVQSPGTELGAGRSADGKQETPALLHHPRNET